MKYIIFELDGKEIPVTFPDVLIHSEVAKGVEYAIRRSLGDEARVQSAGIIHMKVEDCWGYSESLKVKSTILDKFAFAGK